MPKIMHLWELSARKIKSIENTRDSTNGLLVYTIDGTYTSRGWTEWTQGFQFGSELLQFDATGEKEFLEMGRNHTLNNMAPYLTHAGVHDHGFNNISTYGNLLRLMKEGKIKQNLWERRFYELALKCSGATQAHRWTSLPEGGFIYSFNGPHSLFIDTIRSLRVLAVAHKLGHVLMEENERKVSLLKRLIQHARTTAAYNVFFGDGRDKYDIPGRVAHECIFDVKNGTYRCTSSQQGFSPFSTWMRGLAWAMCGYAEELEFLETLESSELEPFGGYNDIHDFMLRTAKATCNFYIENTPIDGIPYWDTGAPLLYKLGDYLTKPADPFNDYEPVDSSAAVIAAQGLLRLGHYLIGKELDGSRYWQGGLTILDTIFEEPYLSTETEHQGLILHSLYHRPKDWDYTPPRQEIPCGESSMWGDYHAREVALYLQRIARGEPYLVFWP